MLFIALGAADATILGFLVTCPDRPPRVDCCETPECRGDRRARGGSDPLLRRSGVSNFPLADLGRGALLSGTLQVVLTVVAVTLATFRFTDTLGTAIFYGFLVAFSSTAVILPILIARGELNAPYGSRTLGVLLLQDLAVIPLVLVIPALAAGASDAPSRIVLQVGIAVVGMALILIVARFIVPRFMERIGRLGSQEGFTAGVVIIVIVLIAAAQKAGVSAAMGAFAAGSSWPRRIRHKIVATLQPSATCCRACFRVDRNASQSRCLGAPGYGAFHVLGVIASRPSSLSGSPRNRLPRPHLGSRGPGAGKRR